MPKTNDNTGATYAGNQGIVEHGAPIEGGRIFSELDPELHLDGTLIEGDHPDHEDGEERDHVTTSDPEPIEGDRGADEEGDNDQAKRAGRQTSVSGGATNPDRDADVSTRGKGATPASANITTARTSAKK